MSVIANNIVAGAAGQGGAAAYRIDRSVRINASDSAYFSRTPSSAGNRKKWTWSSWIKRNELGRVQRIWNTVGGAGNDDNWFAIFFNASDQIVLGGYTTLFRTSSAVYRDCSAWLHLVVHVDLDASTTMKVWVNGVEQTLTGSSNPSQTAINSTLAHQIGRETNNNSACSLQLAEIYFIDGVSSLTADDFGEYDDNNVWQPKEFTFTDSQINGEMYSLGSVSGTLYSGSSWANVFNGVLPSALSTTNSAMTYSSTGDVTLTFPSAISGTIRVWASGASGSATGTDSKIVLSDSSEITCNVLSSAPQWFSFGSKTNITSITLKQAQNGVRLAGIEVDGSLLVDGGVNSFHLDFSDNSSNAALGDDSSGSNNDWTVNNLIATVDPLYSSFATYPSSYNGSAINLFDGSTSTGWQNTDTSGNTYAEVDLTLGGTTSGIAFTTSFEMYGAFSYNQVLEIDHAGGTYTYTSNPGGSGAWVNFASNLTSPVTEIRFKDSGGTGTPSWNAIRVDGSILTDGDQSAIDSLIDTPTNYTASPNNGGNYATLNPLASSSSNALTANGNLDFSVTSGGTWASTLSTIAFNSEKIYFEFGVSKQSPNSGFNGIGSVVAVRRLADQASWNVRAYDSYSLSFGDTGHIKNGATADTSVTSANPAVGDIFGIAIDGTNGTYNLYENGTQLSSGSLNITGYSAGDTLIPFVVSYPDGGGATYGNFSNFNFGQRPFAYTPPTNHLPLVTTSLTDPTIEDPSTAMDVALWTGNGGTQSISGLSMSPDLVWVKQRNTSRNHQLVDTVRGATKDLRSNTTAAESTTSTGLTAFTSDGFTLGGDAGYNQSSGTYVGWVWDGGTTTATNNNGSIQSSVRANQSTGTSIVTWTGTGSSGTIGHGLNSAPELIIGKNRDSTTNWFVGAAAVNDWSKVLKLNTTDALATNGNFNNTAPTSSVFSVGTGSGLNENTKAHIAYCFAPVAGYSAFGTVLGTGSSDGGFAYTGFRPRFLLYRNADATGSWGLYDSERDPDNIAGELLFPNLNNAEQTFGEFDLLSNGIKLRYNYTSGHRLVFAAFAESPFKYSRAR